MEVRIRMANESESRFLADIPFRPDVIEGIIPTLAKWGVFMSNNSLATAEDLSAQFVDDGDKAFFEVIVDAE